MRLLALVFLSLALLLPGTADAVTVQQYSLVQQGNTVTQTFLISRPTTIPLSFSYCNGQSCGNPQDPDLDCYVNLYNPNFTDGFPDTITISPLGSGRPGKVFLKDGNLAGIDLKYGYYDPRHANDWNKEILRSQPTFGSDGSVTLQFNQGPIQAFKDFKRSPRGRLCGITEEQLANFAKQYGTAFDNVNSAAIKVSIVWQVDQPQYANPYDQTVTINGSKQGFQPILQSSPNAMTPVVTPQSNAGQTVPAATATLLNTLAPSKGSSTTFFDRLLGVSRAVAATNEGQGANLAAIEQRLATQGVTAANGQANWLAMIAFLQANRLTAQEVDVATLLRSLDGQATVKEIHPAALGLAALTLHQDRRPDQEAAVVVFGSDVHGNLIVGNPAVNSTTPTVMSYQDFLKGNPWTLLVNRQ